MDSAPRPPFGKAAGAEVDDDHLLSGFVEGHMSGSSPRFHIEESVLMAGYDDAMALRLGRRSFLVRVDPPDDIAHLRFVVEAGFAIEHLSCLDEATLLATPVALQVVGLRLSTWDLWGDDIDDAFALLREAARGDETSAVFALPSVDIDDVSM